MATAFCSTVIASANRRTCRRACAEISSALPSCCLSPMRRDTFRLMAVVAPGCRRNGAASQDNRPARWGARTATWLRPLSAAMLTAAHQTGSLLIQPGQGVIPVRAPSQIISGSARRSQVVAQQSLLGLLSPVGTGVFVGNSLGINAQQVMHPPSAWAAGTASTRCARARPAKTPRTWPTGRSAMIAAASVNTSRPGVNGNSRNIRAEVSSSLRKDSPNAAAIDGASGPLPSSTAAAPADPPPRRGPRPARLR